MIAGGAAWLPQRLLGRKTIHHVFPVIKATGLHWFPQPWEPRLVVEEMPDQNALFPRGGELWPICGDGLLKVGLLYEAGTGVI